MRSVSKGFSLGRDRSDGSKVWQKVILSLDNKKFCLIFRVKLTVFLAAAELSVAEWNIHTKHLGFKDVSLGTQKAPIWICSLCCGCGPGLFWASAALLSWAVQIPDVSFQECAVFKRKSNDAPSPWSFMARKWVYAEFWVAIARLQQVSTFMWNQADHFYPPL